MCAYLLCVVCACRIGMSLVIFGALGDFAAFALAPQTVVTPVGSFTLGTRGGH